jgi:hypothetical protein
LDSLQLNPVMCNNRFNLVEPDIKHSTKGRFVVCRLNPTNYSLWVITRKKYVHKQWCDWLWGAQQRIEWLSLH